MSVAFPIRQGNLLPVFVGKVTYRDDDGKLRNFDFTGWTALTFTAVGPRKTITGSAIGIREKLYYHWTGTDTNTPDTYKATFRGVDPEGRPQTFPTKGELLIEVVPTTA
jgi:hypothetical protein